METDEGPTQRPADEDAPDDAPETPSEAPGVKHRDLAEWRGTNVVDRDGKKIGALQDVYFDIESDEPQFGTVKEGWIAPHLTFVPLVGVTIGPSTLQVDATKEQIKGAPNIALKGELSGGGESELYHHYRLNYSPTDTPSGRRLARR
jgi:hypothetical protein